MKFKQTEEVDVSIDMSPMIDMVFLLLIFFLVASAVVDLDKPDVAIPSASESKVADDVTGRLHISIDRNGQFYIGSMAADFDFIRDRVRQEVEIDPNTRVFIRADEAVPYRISREMMQSFAEIGAVNLIYAAFEE